MELERLPSLLDCLDRAAEYQGKGHRYLEGSGEGHTRFYAELFLQTGGIQRRLLSLGLKRGDRLALIAPHAADFVAVFLAGALLGLVLVPLSPPPPTQRGRGYLDRVRAMLRVAGTRALVAPQTLLPLMEGLESSNAVYAYEALSSTNVEPVAPTIAANLDGTCFLQFTSGSTGDPKGVVITHRKLAANSRAIMVDGIGGISSDDVGVSWLPLFHDMGLIGKLLAPLIYPTQMVYLSTYAFIKNPNVWLDTVSRYRGTISFGPNFAFALATRHFIKRPRVLDLSSLRVLGCGAEPINPEVLERFCQCFEPHGLSRAAVMPSYGMAEATLAVSFDSRLRPFRTLAIERHAYESERRVRPPLSDHRAAQVLRLVGCGRCFPGHEIAIVGSDGQHLPERQVGEIAVRGPSVADGYYANETASAQCFVGGWLHTGDLGFLDDGELFVSGRIKDLIIVNGRNYYPQDLEWVVERVPGVRSGAIAAFSVPDAQTERVVVVAEYKPADGTDARQLIRQSLQQEIGIAVDHVVLVPAGGVPKSTSGKVQRRRTRQLYLDGHYAEVEAMAEAVLES
ncbi:fatty acyl-AMP ligase [Hydrocarboniphaga effusa]|uniref:fatty acyl-AMP ligase n=1 Tax=Hydrocarboniphaga effusa TaxID=243629 RepID=UPI00398BEDD9